MALKTLPPPADYLNRPPKELAGYQQITNIPGNTTSPPAKTLVPLGSLTFHSFIGLPAYLKAQPAGAVNYFNNWLWYDASPFTHARIVTHNHSAGAASSRLYVEYAANGVAFGSAGPIQLSLLATGALKGGWIPLTLGARNDVAFRIMADGGDGVASPAPGDVELEFTVALEPLKEKLYWRNLVPSAQPPANVEVDTALDAYTGALFGGAMAARSFGSCGLPLTPYTTPTVATVQANAKLLSRTKASNNLGATTFAGTGPDAHEDLGSWYARLVGPPLGAQPIDAFEYDHWFTAVSPSAFTDGSVANHLWLYRPGVGRVSIGGGRFAESFAGGFSQKYVRYINRQCHNWGDFPTVPGGALANDRFVLDIVGWSICDCGFLSHNQGIGTWTNYNGTVEPFDPEGLADTGFPGTASYTLLPRFVYLAAA